MEEKKRIRRLLREIRSAIEPQKAEAAAKQVLFHLINSSDNRCFREAENLLAYFAHGGELDARPICELALAEGKQVFFPRVLDKERMEFFPVHSLSDLRPGFQGIWEPPANVPAAFEPCRTLLLLPLLGFDSSGSRLGYGGGYYDRYLSRHPELYAIALAYDEQYYAPGLPVGPYDIRPRKILTPSGYWKKKEEY